MHPYKANMLWACFEQVGYEIPLLMSLRTLDKSVFALAVLKAMIHLRVGGLYFVC